MNQTLKTQGGTYVWHEDWVRCAPGDGTPENGRTHGAAVDRAGNLYVFRQGVPAMLVYDAGGRLIDQWGEYPGAHGLMLVEEDGEELLWLTDQESRAVHKVSLRGELQQSIEPPPYATEEKYVPTWAAVNEVRHGGNGDVWVADGYGSSRVNRYSAAGEFLGSLDGTDGAGEFKCPHGIWFDSRKTPMELWVADRGNHRVQVFDGEGKFLRVFGEEFLTSPDGFARAGEMVVVPELFGRVTLLDAEDRVVAHLGENDRARKDLDPDWPNANAIKAGKFSSPHGAAAGADGSIYVAEWRIGGRVVKLERVG